MKVKESGRFFAHLTILFSPLAWYSVYGFIGLSDISFILIISIVVYDILDKKKIRKTEAILAFAGLMYIFMGAYSVGVEEIYGHISGIRTWVKAALFIPSFVYLFRSESLKPLLYTLTCLSVLVLVSSFVQEAYPSLIEWPRRVVYADRLESLGISSDVNRNSGIVKGYGPYGTYTLPGALVFFTLFSVRDKSGLKIVYLSISIAMIAAIILKSQSRSTMVAAAMGLFTVWVLSPSRSKISRLKKYTVIAGIVVLLALQLGEILNAIIGIHPESVQSRLAQFRVGISVIMNNFFGVGMVETGRASGGSLHNTYLSIGVQGGILSMAIFLYYNYVAVKNLFMEYLRRQSLVVITFSGLFVTSVIEMMFYDGSSNLIHYIIISICITSHCKNE